MRTSRITWLDNIEKMKMSSKIYIRLNSKDLVTKFNRKNMKSKKEIIDSKEQVKKEKLKSQGLPMRMGISEINSKKMITATVKESKN